MPAGQVNGPNLLQPFKYIESKTVQRSRLRSALTYIFGPVLTASAFISVFMATPGVHTIRHLLFYSLFGAVSGLVASRGAINRFSRAKQKRLQEQKETEVERLKGRMSEVLKEGEEKGEQVLELQRHKGKLIDVLDEYGIERPNFEEIPFYQSFVFKKYLGEGAMGMVFHVRRMDLNFAFKIPLPQHIGVVEIMSRFEGREVKSMLQMEPHPNIVRMYDTHELQPQQYLQLLREAGLKEEIAQYGKLIEGLKQNIKVINMELIPEGITIADRLDRTRRRSHCSVHEAVRYAIDVARAFEHIEALGMGMIHRDLKPENVFLVQDKKTGETIAKVGDFGLAYIPKPGKESGTDRDSRLTKFNTTIGTPEYMPPEQWSSGVEGIKVDARTDMYALGCMLFEMLCGKLPYGDVAEVGGIEALAARVLNPQIPARDIRQFVNVPNSLVTILYHLIARKMDDRPANWRQVLDNLEYVGYELTKIAEDKTAVARIDVDGTPHRQN